MEELHPGIAHCRVGGGGGVLNPSQGWRQSKEKEEDSLGHIRGVPKIHDCKWTPALGHRPEKGYIVCPL